MPYQPKYRARRKRARVRALPVFTMLLAVALLITAIALLRRGENGGIAFTESRDTQPPELFGVQDVLIYQGEDRDLLAGVTAADDLDPAPALQVNATAGSFADPGTYTITYTATDAAGNTATASATVTVLRWKQGYATLDAVHQAAQTLLDTIIDADMDPRQQVRAVYKWTLQNLSYGGHSPREDRYQAAYLMLTQQQGDCYGYFAVTKLLFDKLGIPNIDVVKVRNTPDDSDHFWSLVSVDRGDRWYHFDATPRKGEGDDFCLVTDAFLDAYSKKHSGSHNRDASLYPATPA